MMAASPEPFAEETMRDVRAEIDRLIDGLLERVASERNARRGSVRPAFSVGLEEPILWVKLFGLDIRRFYSDPEYFVERTLRHRIWAFDRIDDDARLDDWINAYLGHYPEYTYLGMTVAFDREGVPSLSKHPVLGRSPDLSALEPVAFGRSGWMGRQLEWHERVSEIVGGRLKVRFQRWWRGPLDLAVGMRGYEALMEDAAERPDFVAGLLGFITDQRIAWYRDYCAHFGASMPAADIGDDWLNAPFVSPSFFGSFVLPQYLRIEAAQGRMGSIHSCGNQAPFQRLMLELKTLGHYEVSPWTPLEAALANVPADKGLSVVFHPNDVLFGTAGEVEAKARRILEACRGRRFGIGTGGVTPVEKDGAEADFLARIRRFTDAFRRARGDGA
jgi:hypothetical protein